MKKVNSLSDWKFRILNASSCELVVISYKLIFENLEQAKISFAEGDIESFEERIKSAQDYLMELMTSLDMSYEISLELMQLYLHVNQKMIRAYSRKNIENIDQSIIILKNLFVAWEKIAKDEADKTPLMANTQQVYAGLTYGRQNLNETVMDDDNRGFKA